MVDGDSERIGYTYVGNFYTELHRLRITKCEAMIEQDYVTAFDCLCQLYVAINIKLTPEESLNVRQLIKVGEKLIEEQSGYSGFTEGARQFVQLRKLKHLLLDLDSILMRCMHKHHLIFHKPETLGLEKIRKRYNLYEHDEPE